MYISNLLVRNYKSIEAINIKLDKLSMLCGPNSAGKSNILKALCLAFEKLPNDIDVISEIVRTTLSKSKQNSSASIQIEVTFNAAPKLLYKLAGIPITRSLKYKFKITKGGTLSRKLGETQLDSEQFLQLLDGFSVVYIPTIRDINSDGLKPFQDLFKRSIEKAHGGRELKKQFKEIKESLSNQALTLLGDQKSLVQKIMNVKGIELDTDNVVLESLYEGISLQLKKTAKDKSPLKEMGTGHQSAVIINLYRQFGASLPGHTLYLFEEPDAHLHPPTIRAIGDELNGISATSQVLITTHSPILVSHMGLDNVFHLKNREAGGTEIIKTDMSGVSQASLGHKLLKYGLRITEALFSKLVVLVEGKADALVVGRLIERRTGKTCDQLDLLIVPAGGKCNIVEIAEVLGLLNIDWFTIFDFDAAMTTSTVPITTDSVNEVVADELVKALVKIESFLNINSKRGKKSQTQIRLIKDELKNGVPSKGYYNNSELQNLLESTYELSQSKVNLLTLALKKNKIRERREILNDFNIWLLNPDLEGMLLGRSNLNAEIIDPILRKKKIVKIVQDDDKYYQSLKNTLHNLASKPDVYVEVIDAIDAAGGFKQTDLNMAINSIIEII